MLLVLSLDGKTATTRSPNRIFSDPFVLIKNVLSTGPLRDDAEVLRTF